jgi:hypothetical protein
MTGSQLLRLGLMREPEPGNAQETRAAIVATGQETRA